MAGNVCDKYCMNCIYYVGACDTVFMCNYYLQTGKRRPCDPGKGCTVRVLRKKNRRTRKDRDREKVSNAFSKAIIAGLTAEPIPEIVEPVKRLAEAVIKKVGAEDGK